MKTFLYKLMAGFMCIIIAVSLFACSNEPEAQQVSLAEAAPLESSSYLSGDTMGDYTLTDVNGESHTFSEILKEKKAIVLNFWFINCGPCKLEFPYLVEAYENYKEDIEVLAINPVGESAEEIKAFAEDFSLTFPVIEGESGWQSAMHIEGYPTTVVIDKFGKIAFKHTGYLDSTESFEDIFEFFTSEDYTASVVKNLSNI